MHKVRTSLTFLALVVGSAAGTFAQSLPTTQPKFLHIYRETLKPGRAAEHAKWEAGWPAAYEKAGFKNAYLAISSLTGPQEVWFISPYASQAAFGEAMAAEANPALGAELERLSKGDGEFLNDLTAIQLEADAELSQGSFPDLSTVRFYEVMTIRMKYGYDGDWAAAMQAYKAAAAKASPASSWRTYRVVAGAPAGTYLLMSTTTSFAEFDKMAANSASIWKAIPEDQLATIQKFFREGVLNVVTQRFKVEPSMSYVDAATRAKVPAFWGPKK
jgi:hypothetical protein